MCDDADDIHLPSYLACMSNSPSSALCSDLRLLIAYSLDEKRTIAACNCHRPYEQFVDSAGYHVQLGAYRKHSPAIRVPGPSADVIVVSSA